jgi:polyisoprenoid-binding protein YceI
MSAAHIRGTGFSIARDAQHSNGTSTTRTTYTIDPAASRVEFTIRKRLFFVIHQLVTGRFSDVRGTINLDEREPANSQAEVTIGAASVNTRMGKRDKHLRNADFFDVERHSTLRFESRHIETIDRGKGQYRVVGDLTVRGVTRAVTLDTHYVPAQGDDSAGRIALTLTGTLNRRDFGMIWNRSYIDVADDLIVTLEVEATRA